MQLVLLTIMVTWCEEEGGKKGERIRGGGTVEGGEKPRQREREKRKGLLNSGRSGASKGDSYLPLVDHYLHLGAILID